MAYLPGGFRGECNMYIGIYIFHTWSVMGMLIVAFPFKTEVRVEELLAQESLRNHNFLHI